jgi:hypothetical protein
MRKIFLLLIVALLSFHSCEKAEEIIDPEDNTLTDAQIADGLKEALKVGTDTAVSIVSKVDGYYGDNLIKIFLPPGSDKMVTAASILGNQQQIDDLILMINRSAEDAAPEAVNIFVTAITNMTIVDAINILHGEDSAATHFLRDNTYYELYQAFKPKIEASLDKELVLGASANTTWTAATTLYNNAYPLDPVGTDLSTHVTEKALDGLFEKIKAEEKQIREDPNARVSDILKDVFGELD